MADKFIKILTIWFHGYMATWLHGFIVSWLMLAGPPLRKA